MTTMKVKKVNPLATIPTRAHADDAAFDLYTIEGGVIEPGQVKVFKTGIAFEIPFGWAGFYWDRSSLGSKGIHVMAGVIDAGYRAEHLVCLNNLGGVPYTIEPGQRIAQIVFQRVYTGSLEEVNELSTSVRGENGWGSTGK